MSGSRLPLRRARVLAPIAFALAFVAALASALPARAASDPAHPPPTSSESRDRPSGDDEAADSPRASMRSFFDLCDRSRYDEAGRYLDVPPGAEKRTAEFAQKLDVILRERLWIDPEQLSPDSEGRKTDALPAGTEELGKLDGGKGRPIAIRIVRHQTRSPEDEPRWVFSQSTVQNVDALYGALKGRWVREHFPAALLAQGPKSLYYWQWIALPLLALFGVGLGRLLTSITGVLARWLTAKRPWGPRLLHRLRRPVTMAWALLAFWMLLPYVGLTVRAEDLLERVLRALGYLAFFWALVRTVTIAGDEVAEAHWARERPNIRAVTGVGVRLGKVVVGALALMVALSALGYPVTTVIAGLGIGGVALALAAQKTVENLFGSVAILADQPFGVGDTIRVDGVEGVVESIGLRSTRLRTVERTLVIVPNGKLADMRIESLGPRDRIRFSAKLALAREATPRQIEDIVEKVRTKMASHAAIQEKDVFVRLSAIGESSFDVDVAAPVDTLDANEFARIREELLLGFVRILDEGGVKLAIPIRQILGTASGASAVDVKGLQAGR